jgi:Polysulphide reductase, NrfD
VSDNGRVTPEAVVSYHGQAVLKEPVWTWEIPLYFYTGGVAGASAGLAYLSGLRGNDVLARRAWGAAMIGIGVSPALLISDLGRPERFLNMMRMFKVTSPMSVGTWILTVSGSCTTVAAGNALTGLFPGAAKLARPVAALFGLPLSTYTAALVANTAVPVWHEARRELPVVFGSGAALGAGAAAVIATPPADAAPARRLAIGAGLLEAGFSELMEKRLGNHGDPYRQGDAARYRNIGRACIAGGTALLASAGGRSRAAAVAAGVLLSAGAVSVRFSVFKAGAQSAADPKYVVGPQRSGIDQGRRKGAARHQPTVARAGAATGSPAPLG